MGMYSALQKQIKPQMLAILLVSLILLTLIAGYLYVLKSPVQDFIQARQTLELLDTELQTGVPVASQIESFQQQVSQLHQQLHGNSQNMPLNQMIAFVIGQMDRIAATHDVKLISVEPGNVVKIFMFQELPFHVTVTGNFFSLFDWLNQVEHDVGPIVIKKFELASEPNSTLRRFTLTLVSYQFEEEL
jgi:Tfp pilus assembly protein PilO